MEPKNTDNKGRWRDQILGIHVTEAERARLEELALNEGTNKRKYLIDCLDDSTIHVHQNARIAALLNEKLQTIYEKLLQISSMFDMQKDEYHAALSAIEKALGKN